MNVVNMKVGKLATIINDELKKDAELSINKLCENLGLKASTVKTKFRRNGYVYNKELRMYEKAPTEMNNNNLEVQVQDNDTNNINQQQEKGEPMPIQLLSDDNINIQQAQANDKPRETVDMALNHNIGKTIPNTVEPLTESEIMAIRKLLKQVQDNDNNKPNTIQVNTEICKGDVVTINMKIYENTNKKWQEHLRKNSHIRKQDLLTMAIEFYLDHH